jgi:UDP:flavonoid glycosyltransferase YjiC (YdhE family)
VRVLITSIPQVSHIFPIVPTAQALQAAGHEVLVAAQPKVAPALTSAGLPVQTVGPAFDMLAFFRARLPSGMLPLDAWQFDLEQMNAVAAHTWSKWARGVLGAQLELVSSWPPDLIICDPMELAAPIVGGILNVPVVEHRWGPDPTIGFHREAAKRMRPALRAHGLGQLPTPAFVLDPCPPSLKGPGTEPGHPVRYIPYNGSGALPEGALAGDRPRVCVSFGSVAASLTEGALVRWTLEALSEIPGITVTLAVTRKDLSEIGMVPGDVEVLLDVPLNLITGQCDVLIHHGGDGTGMTGLCHGVPQVILPQLRVQSHFGELIEGCGAGRNLGDSSAQRSPATIRAAVQAVLDEPGCRAAAQRLQAEIEDMPTPAAVVARLEQVAAVAVS